MKLKQMKLTDTHCHLDFNKFDEDRAVVIQRAMDAGLTKILIPALDWESSLAVVELANSNPMLFAAVGFHPTDVEKFQNDSLKKLRELILLDQSHLSSAEAKPQIKGKIVAIGEIGLDYYWVKEPEKQARQREVLQQQLNLAAEMKKPVILHMREANDAWFGPASADLLEIITDWHTHLKSNNHPLAERPGVLHSFNGNLETAQKAITLNFFIGVTGPVTYKNAEEKRNIIRQLPLERILIETDSPFLAPHPHRGKRNEPAFVSEIADKIAQLHSRNQSEVAAITSSNASRLFDWGD